MSSPVSSSPSAGSPVTLPAVGWRAHLPNILTGLRLVVALAFFIQLSVWSYPARDLISPSISPLRPLWPYLIAAALFGLAALTDAIDGPLARRWNAVSQFGRVMDPFADKILVVGAFVMLASPKFAVDSPGVPPFQVSGVESWMVVVILARELLVTSLRSVLESSGVDFSANAWGKAKMILQATLIPVILVTLGITEITRGTWGRWVIDSGVWLTMVVTVVSGVPYVTQSIRHFRAGRSRRA